LSNEKAAENWQQILLFGGIRHEKSLFMINPWHGMEGYLLFLRRLSKYCFGCLGQKNN
jgi:hypothetical protein